jgi:hypothetical protein
MPAATIGQGRLTRSGPRGAPTAWKNIPARMQDKLAMPMTERSMPPVSIATIIAMASRPSSGAMKVMDSKT